jgi:hypothetical protein
VDRGSAVETNEQARGFMMVPYGAW